jgi:hypothetical protein
MCFGGSVARMTPPEREFKNRPVTVTGRQTGVDNPIDTAKFTESLRIQRQKEEGTYVDPNLTTVEKLTRSGGGNKTAQQKANLAANRKKAQSLAKARKAARTAPKGQGAGAMRSDIRLKENVSEVGLSKLGYKIYEFNYKNDDTRYRGAMAQDVMTKLPEAIGVKDGFLYVDYDMIDISMEVI